MGLTRADLRPKQNQLVEFIKTREACAGWVPMGLGKTVSALTAFLDLLNSFDANRALVVAPLRVARRVWTDEIKTWKHLNGLKTQRIIGDVSTRWLAFKSSADIHLINREQIPWLEAQFIQNKKQVRKFPWDVVILDESQSFKHQSSQRWKSMNKLRRLTNRVVELTGTPASNGYQDLWAQVKLLDYGQRLGRTEEAFRDRWFNRIRTEENYDSWEIKDGAKEQIEKAIADIVMVIDDDIDAPPVIYNPIRVTLPEPILRAYKKFERERIMELKGQQITAVNAAACAGKLLQFANGAVYHDKKGNWTHVHDEKINALLEVVDCTSGPVIVVYEFRHDLQRILGALKKTSKRVDVLKSEESENRWNDGKTDVLVLHPASAGHGLNLQHAGSEAIIWFGLTPDLDHYHQANARLIGGHRRVGRNVVINRILADDTRDDAIAALLEQKDGTQRGLMEALL